MERVVSLGLRGLLALAALAGATTAARSASAADAGSAGGARAVLWTIEAQPWPCSRLVAALAREVELACDASGGACHVAAAEDPPILRAVLRCSADDSTPWSLSAEAMDGEEVWTLSLGGDVEERLRKGALAIARTPAPEPTAPVAPVAPSRSAARRRAPPEAPLPPPELEPDAPENGGLTLDTSFRVGTDGTRATGV